MGEEKAKSGKERSLTGPSGSILRRGEMRKVGKIRNEKWMKQRRKGLCI